MLRAVVHQNRIREVALQYIGTPVLPITQVVEQLLYIFVLPVQGIAAQQFDRRRWRARARIQQRDLGLAARKRLVDHRYVADNERQEAEPGPRLYDCQRPRQSGDWYDIPIPERKKGHAAEREIRAEVYGPLRCKDIRPNGPLNEREGNDEDAAPTHQ